MPKVVTTLEASESPLPAQVQEALGELVGAARERLLVSSVGALAILRWFQLGAIHQSQDSPRS